MLYEYILTAYKVIVGLITTKRLIMFALIAFAFYLIWISMALLFSFQRRFSSNCIKLFNYIRKNQIDRSKMQFIDYRAEKISSGFYHGWKKFKNSTGKNPSDVITRRESLDVEVNGGVLNQGKTLMRAFINFVTIVLFVLNLAYLGNDSPITCYLIAETMILPLIFFMVMKLFYFLYTSIRQQMYKTDAQCFYDLIALLDDTFGTRGGFVQPQVIVQTDDEKQEEVQSEEPKKESESEISETEQAENETAESREETEPEEPENPLDSYDVFKKKNIDIDKIMGEVPKQANNLPYINVDSDFVIKDDNSDIVGKAVQDNDTGSSILGGMMQDMSSIKKSNNFINTEKEVAEIDEEKLAENTSTKTEEKEEDPFSSFEKYAIPENSPSEKKQLETDSEKEESAETVVENSDSEKKDEPQEKKSDEVKVLIPAEDEVSDSEKETIASVVSGIRHKSKLANGGVEIERNEPIARRDRAIPRVAPTSEDNYENNIEAIVEESAKFEPSEPIARREVTELSVDDNADNILNSLKSSAGGYDQQPVYDYNQNYNGGYGYSYEQPYNQPIQPVSPYNPYVQGAGMQTPVNPGYAYQGQVYAPYNSAPVQNQPMDNYEYDEPVDEMVDDEYEEPEKPAKSKATKKVYTKENEPRPRNLRKRRETVEEVKTPTKTRGRPKKAEVSETMTIKNDKEFDEVLARAEKLMRKSDEGLSQSQSKRIEKELKLLMDAMNRYKESK